MADRVTQVLDSAHPHFFTIKKHWPHFFLPNSLISEPVYLERTGEFKVRLGRAIYRTKARGCQ
jgi:hypothetical protein